MPLTTTIKSRDSSAPQFIKINVIREIISRLSVISVSRDLGMAKRHDHGLMDESLREAACQGNLDSLKRLLQTGSNVNSQNGMNGWSANLICK